MRGLIQIDRSIFKHPIVGMNNPVRFTAWCWMLSNARWKPQDIFVDGKIISLQRGQLFFSIRNFAAQINVSKGVAERFLRDLKTGSMIETVTETGGTIVTICNYDKFQDFNFYNKTSNETQNETGAGQSQDDDETGAGHKRIPDGLPDELPEGLPEILGQPDNSKLEISQAFEAYNLAAQENDWAVCQKISKARNSQMKARLKDCGGIDGFMACLEKCKASDFLQGRVGGSNGAFQLGIDFILRDSSFTKIMEGNYDNRKQPEKQKSMSSASMFFEAARQAEGLSQ